MPRSNSPYSYADLDKALNDAWRSVRSAIAELQELELAFSRTRPTEPHRLVTLSDLVKAGSQAHKLRLIQGGRK